jgi:outer membrane protein OmpA-like peptidoglycan-associated protein
MRAALSSIVLIGVLAGCATPRGADSALEQARAAYAAAQADPAVSTHAGGQLDLAARLLREAERSSGEERTHRAYLAEQRARIAREVAHTRANEQAALEARLKQTEEERATAQSRAQAAEAERDLNDKLSAHVRRLQAQVAELQARETERGWILTLGADLLFGVGSASLKPSGRRAIADLARFMREHPERHIVIEGFTDNHGSARANQRLSERRAQVVRDALVKHGIDAERIAARGLGEAYPVASNQDPNGRSRNRRVEILIGETPGRAATGGTAKPATR